MTGPDPVAPDYIALAGSRAKGKRPAYFADPAIDRLLSIVLALAGEVAVNRERLDSLERLLDARGTVSRADLEGFVPDADAGYERGLWHREFTARILRGVQQDMESLQSAEPSIADISAELRDT
jgi:hypothetical protein